MIKSRILRWAGHVARTEKGSTAFKILAVKLIKKISPRRSRCKLEDCIRIDVKEIGDNARNWIDSVLDWDYWIALVNAALHFSVP